MQLRRTQLGRLALAAMLTCALAGAPASAAINASQLGAAYDAQSNVNFKLYSSRATRIELFLYSAATGSQEKARIVMTKGAGNIWTASVTASALTAAMPTTRPPAAPRANSRPWSRPSMTKASRC